MSRAAVQMLQRRWGLPDAATPALDRFFTAWAAGHTSIELSDEEAGLLAPSAAVTDGSDSTCPAPLVLRGTRLQSWRLDQAETRVAARLRELAHEDVPVAGRPSGRAAPDAADDLAELFPDPQSAQRRAAELGLRQALALVTGGPGTGKTTTAARLLALLANRDPGIRVALAAPTGKAAARLGEAIGQAAQDTRRTAGTCPSPAGAGRRPSAHPAPAPRLESTHRPLPVPRRQPLALRHGGRRRGVDAGPRPVGPAAVRPGTRHPPRRARRPSPAGKRAAWSRAR